MGDSLAQPTSIDDVKYLIYVKLLARLSITAPYLLTHLYTLLYCHLSRGKQSYPSTLH